MCVLSELERIAICSDRFDLDLLRSNGGLKLAGVLEALDFGGEALAEGGIAEGIAQFHLELAIEDSFVGVAALGGGFGDEGRHGLAQRF